MDIVAYATDRPWMRKQQLRQLQEMVRVTQKVIKAETVDGLIRLPNWMEWRWCLGGCGGASRLRPGVGPCPAAASEHTSADRDPQRSVYRVADINAARNVAGGAINMAQRVMDCGDAGHILVSNVVAEVVGQVSTWSGSWTTGVKAEVKHGTRVHLYNLFTNDAGNPELPQKLRTRQPAGALALSTASRRKLVLILAVRTLVALVAGAYWYLHRPPKITDKAASRWLTLSTGARRARTARRTSYRSVVSSRRRCTGETGSAANTQDGPSRGAARVDGAQLCPGRETPSPLGATGVI